MKKQLGSVLTRNEIKEVGGKLKTTMAWCNGYCSTDSDCPSSYSDSCNGNTYRAGCSSSNWYCVAYNSDGSQFCPGC